MADADYRVGSLPTPTPSDGPRRVIRRRLDALTSNGGPVPDADIGATA